jgi:hypothetical protein
MVTQRGLADAAAKESLDATNKAIAAPHPALATTYQHEAGQALKRQGAAHAAADAAENELETAKRRGRHASDAYKLAETALSQQLHAARGGLHPAPKLSGAAPVPISVTGGDARLANSLLRAIAARGVEGLTYPFDGTELAALLGRPVTPGAVQAFNHARRELLDDMKPKPWGDKADRFGGEIKGLIGIHVFGNPETGGYKAGERLGGMATDVTLGTTCVILSAGTCAAAGGGLFVARSGGVYQSGGGAKKMAKAELFNAVKTGLSAAPGGALGVVPPVAKAIQTSGSLGARVAAGKAASKALEEGLGKLTVTVGKHEVHVDIPIKLKLELLGGGVSQGLEQAKISAERE